MKTLIFGLLTLLLMASPTTYVFADDLKPVNQEEANHKFELVDEKSLSKVEKAFVEKVKKLEGMHQLGHLYVISLGEQPNPGYTLEFVEQEQTLEQLELYFKKGLPRIDTFYPDVIVYPYVVGKVKLPPYTTLSLFDTANQALFKKKTSTYEFWEARSVIDTNKVWTVNFNRAMSEKMLKNYVIYIEELKNGLLINHPSSVTIDKGNRKAIKVKPLENYELSATYLLSIESKFKNGKKIVIPFQMSEGININYNFDEQLHGWSGEFSDLPVDYDKEQYGLEFGHKQVPVKGEPLTNGLYLSGQNSSDDLFMFAKKKVGKTEGLLPNTKYLMNMEIGFYTNADPGLVGIGGAPGESVFVKAGASTMEPNVVELNGDFRMNIDKGEQGTSGINGIIIGDVAKVKETGDESFKKKNLSTSEAIEVKTDSNGELWLFFGTDSGFEGRTSLYYNSINVTLIKK